MTRDDSEWVNGLFAASACDWTPGLATHTAHVLYAPVSRDPEASWRCASVLSDPELQRADRFVTEDGKARFKQRRAFRRYCGAFALGSPRPLSRIVFKETEKGRPYLPDLPDIWFSFSSCRFGFLGAWSSTHKIGVDLEDQTRNLEAAEVAQLFFSQAEVKAVKALGGLARAAKQASSRPRSPTVSVPAWPEPHPAARSHSRRAALHHQTQTWLACW